jgi:acetolactate synthase I/II/III large subunit
VTAEVLGSGGRLAAEVLGRHDVDTVFTLSGGHLFPFYDGCVQTDIRLVDVRHEQTATFAAEGWAKVTRRVGVCALTAGPGVTNGVSALTAAQLSGSPVFAIGGRAPAERWGSGSLQELDPVPILTPVVKHAATAPTTEAIPATFDTALRAARTPHRGPTFVDVALDVFVNGAMGTVPDAPEPEELVGGEPDPEAVAKIARLVREAEHPVLVAGGDVYWDRAEVPLRGWAESARLPVFANGMGRGTVPADHELAFARARSLALREADLVIVAGTPLDFRLGFGVFGDARVVHICDAPERVARHASLAAASAGDLGRTFTALTDAVAGGAHDDWIEMLRAEERARRAVDAEGLHAATTPIKPRRIYGELRARLARDAIVIGDGGDFVSYAGQLIDSYEPGCFLDPGPFGCLGMGPGYALAAGIAHPGRQLVLLLGDGAIGFSLGDLDTLVRFGIDVVMIVGNNGIWGLEKHPMEFFFGYSVVAELRPGTRYDLVLEALGGHGELVEEPQDLGPALDRAFATKGPSLVNVLTDPADAYPRSSNLG